MLQLNHDFPKNLHSSSTVPSHIVLGRPIHQTTYPGIAGSITCYKPKCSCSPCSMNDRPTDVRHIVVMPNFSTGDKFHLAFRHLILRKIRFDTQEIQQIRICFFCWLRESLVCIYLERVVPIGKKGGVFYIFMYNSYHPRNMRQIVCVDPPSTEYAPGRLNNFQCGSIED